MHFHLFEIAIYLWLESIGDTKEFQFAFVVKLCEIIFLRQLTMEEKCWFSLCLKNCSKRSLFLNRYLVSSRNALSFSLTRNGGRCVNTECPMSTIPAKIIPLAWYVCLSFSFWQAEHQLNSNSVMTTFWTRKCIYAFWWHMRTELTLINLAIEYRLLCRSKCPPSN